MQHKAFHGWRHLYPRHVTGEEGQWVLDEDGEWVGLDEDSDSKSESYLKSGEEDVVDDIDNDGVWGFGCRQW